MQTQEDHSNLIRALNVDSLKVDLVVMHNTCLEKEESNSETASSKSVKECILNSEIKDVHAIKYKMSKAKERCMAYFQSLHSHLQTQESKIHRVKQGGLMVWLSWKAVETESEVQDDLAEVQGMIPEADDAVIRPFLTKSKWLEVQLTG
ncbi:hypothetical protein Tco_0749482 [Tanacetum coccineum]|uniref:Uncharacterized protein n=1 Tax=Tanacetum coccineum TaxID=301880 RepID=A0ABQ4YZJ5_9ASTR